MPCFIRTANFAHPATIIRHTVPIGILANYQGAFCRSVDLPFPVDTPHSASLHVSRVPSCLPVLHALGNLVSFGFPSAHRLKHSDHPLLAHRLWFGVKLLPVNFICDPILMQAFGQHHSGLAACTTNAFLSVTLARALL